jgi:Cu-Zn family superoxide dismutase
MSIRTVVAACGLTAVLATYGAAESAKATIATPPGSSVPVSGTVMLQDTPGGLKIDAQITQAPAGTHAFHIHEFGSCDGQGKAAGSHYNPANHPHGNAIKDGIAKTHAGDFGNLTVGADGKGSLQATLSGLSLTGKTPVAGRAFILHEKTDDFSQPAGNAGERIGCGPIVLVKP